MQKLDHPDRVNLQPIQPFLDALRLTEDTNVVELGVGTGYFALPIARFLSNEGGHGTVLGLDVAEEMLDSM